MKKIGLIAMSMLLVASSWAQQTKEEEKDSIVFVSENEVDDTTHIRIGKKGLNIIEDENGTSVDIVDIDVDIEEDFDKDKDKNDNPSRRFEGHWEGLELGMANFVDADYSMSRQGAESYMDLHTGRSFNFNLNLTQYDVGLGTSYLGLVTGLGLEFSSYFFDHNNSIIKNPETGVIEPYNYTMFDINLDKSKLVTTYLTLPLLLEAQIGPGRSSKRFHVSAGVVGGLKLGSHTKVVYRQNGSKEKDKDKDDFSLNALRYGLTARAGFKSLKVYGTYYITPLFEDGKGPELFPIALGLALDF